MDLICSILEKHERWVKELEPEKGDKAKLQHWNLILEQLEKNLHIYEMLTNVERMRGKELPNPHNQRMMNNPVV